MPGAESSPDYGGITCCSNTSPAGEAVGLFLAAGEDGLRAADNCPASWGVGCSFPDSLFRLCPTEHVRGIPRGVLTAGRGTCRLCSPANPKWRAVCSCLPCSSVTSAHGSGSGRPREAPDRRRGASQGPWVPDAVCGRRPAAGEGTDGSATPDAPMTRRKGSGEGIFFSKGRSRRGRGPRPPFPYRLPEPSAHSDCERIGRP